MMREVWLIFLGGASYLIVYFLARCAARALFALGKWAHNREERRR